MKRCFILTLLLVLGTAMSVHAALRKELVEYTIGADTFEGYLVYDDAVKDPRPAVLVVHEWYGLNDYARMRTEQLAGMGYVAFAVDMYGKGRRATSREEAGKLAGAVRGDRPLMRTRMRAALDVVRRYPFVDRNHIAAIGYCFGGTCVLELARSGADLSGVVSFHGGLDTPNPGETGTIKPKVLVLHGADDPNVPPAQVQGFEEEMRRVKADWHLVAYGGAVHGFTNPGNGDDPSRGVAYNAAAERRSWQAMQFFFDETLK